MTGRRVLLLGAGGAARGAMLPVLKQRPAMRRVVNRTLSKAKALVDEFSSFASGDFAACSYTELADIPQPFDMTTNVTSASLRGELPPVHAHAFASDGLAYELADGKGLTPFLRLAQGTGVQRLADGVGMLVEQAAKAFAWWCGVRPETRAMISTLTVPLV